MTHDPHHDTHAPLAIVAGEAAPRLKPSNYPAEFQPRVAGRTKRPLGLPFGLSDLGVNLTTLAPGAESALMHRHSQAEEFVYVLSGRPTLRTDRGAVVLEPGHCAGFPRGGVAHHLVNETDEDVTYLEIGTNPPGDEGSYPQDDLEARRVPGGWAFVHKDGRPY